MDSEFQSEHVGPWTDWQGNLDAEIMVVGQEWGGVDNYLDQNGRDRDTDPTNDHLVELITSISAPLNLTPIRPPTKCQGKNPAFKGPHYFTNSLLCLKSGRATHKEEAKGPERSCYVHCCKKFLKAQIEIVQPHVVVTLGKIAYVATMRAYDRKPQSSMKAALNQEPLRISENTLLVPLFHTGYWGWMTRNKDNPVQQKQDWRRVVSAVLEGRARLQTQ
jgi:DNA polymerase